MVWPVVCLIWRFLHSGIFFVVEDLYCTGVIPVIGGLSGACIIVLDVAYVGLFFDFLGTFENLFRLKTVNYTKNLLTLDVVSICNTIDSEQHANNAQNAKKNLKTKSAHHMFDL